MTAGLILLSGASDPSIAEWTALGRVRAYIAVHNAHELDAAVGFYADDAEFKLNGGRPPVYGRAAIRQLEAFDVAAGSNVEPKELTARTDGANVVVALRTVVEHSRVFAALGLASVTTEPVDAFVVRPDGFFATVAQPEFRAACRQLIPVAFEAIVAWLQATGDARAPVLTADGAIKLSAATIPAVVEAIGDWRKAIGWSPNASLAARCADAR